MYYRKIKNSKKEFLLNRYKQFVHNMSSHTLSPTEYSLLSKGLFFIPTPRETVQHDLEADIANMANDIRRRYFFRRTDATSHIRHPFKDTSIYESLNGDPTIEASNDIHNFMDKLKEHGYIDETTHSFLKQEESPKTQRLYFLKKLHKTPISVRPIVSGTGGITEKVSAFLDHDHFLQPLLTNIPSYLKNSTELIELISSMSVSVDDILVTIDVSSLYLNIPQEEGVTVTLDFMEAEGALPLPRPVLEQLLNIVLKCNIFKFGGQIYKQIKGTAMGTKCAPAFAGIFMHQLEQQFLEDAPLKPSLYRRYIDDIFLIWPHCEDSLKQLLTSLNEAHHSIKFTWDYSLDKVTFLDLDIYKNGTTSLQYRTHFKGTNSFQYVQFSSFHPSATKKGIYKGELTRVHRTTSDVQIREETTDFIKDKFTNRGYPSSLTSTHFPE